MSNFYYSDEYIPVKEKAVPIEESSELLSGNIGESSKVNNTEITLGIKEPKVSYSIESEPEKNIISPRVSDIQNG